MSKMVEVWYEWGETVGSGTALEWCKVEDYGVVKRIQWPEVAEDFEMHQTALHLVESARRAQRTVCDVSNF